MRACVVDFLRHSSGVPIVGPWLEQTNQGPERHWHTLRPEYPLLGQRPRIAQLRFTKHDYGTPNNELITEVEANQIGAV